MIYILEDDSSVRELEAYALRAAGFEVRGFADADAFLEAARDDPPSLAILDVMLPGAVDGLEAMKRLREFSPRTFVIIASAKGSEFDRVRGLDLGADDYLAKPFSMLEMTSRVKAVLRRGGAGESETLAAGEVVLDRSGHTVIVSGRDVRLTRREFQLLEIFLSHPRRVFTREALLERVWGADGTLETRTVDMHIASLRAKLGRAAAIETVRGIGYKLGGEE
jgi:two-component system alkaline phosphatase synthesis response regulator PhoP